MNTQSVTDSTSQLPSAPSATAGNSPGRQSWGSEPKNKDVILSAAKDLFVVNVVSPARGDRTLRASPRTGESRHAH